MKTDIEIANSTKWKPIIKIAKKIGIKKSDIILFGDYKAKINCGIKESLGKLVLVTAINPTASGNGKTTVAIGLADALTQLKKKTALALREPSLGPVFGMKGGATGGGYSQVVPMEDINLHFNGDFHAITSANNLLCANIDNHIFQGNELNIDEKTIMFNRCLDINDRALRDVDICSEYERKEKFNITAASEIMAIMCLAKDIEDLKTRLGDIMVALDKNGNPIYARDLKVENAMAILLKDAMKPNLVQTLGGTPAIIHMGPFANIAHGCNSIIATKTAMSLADYTVTEAGFGSDLGAEKFLDIKCRLADIKPNCVVLVATIKALKFNGGADKNELDIESLDALKNGMPNLLKHLENLTNVYNVPTVVTLNKFATDTDAEVKLVKEMLKDKANVIVNEVWAKGGMGAIQLAKEVVKLCDKEYKLNYAYELNDTVENKILNVVTKIYGGKSVIISEKAKAKIEIINRLGFDKYPIVIAKTQYSLSDNPKLLGAPTNFDITVDDIEIKNGAKFLVVMCGKMLLMPGLSKKPASMGMKIDKNGNISGLF